MRYEVRCARSDFAVSPVAIGFSSDREVTHFGPVKREQYIIHYVKREQYIIHYVTKGFGYFCGNKVCAGQGFLITPGMLEEYHSSEEDPWTFLWMVAYGADMEKLFRMCNADEKSGIFDYDFVPQIEGMFEYLTVNSDKILGILEMQELFYKIFSLHDRTRDSSTAQKNSQIYLDYATEMIWRNYAKNLKVSELCERLGVSEPYLFRLFKERFGKSPKRYISDIRISQSKMLLSETDMSVTDVGCAVGYDDVLAFSKFFSSNTGMSPTEYRCKNMREI